MQDRLPANPGRVLITPESGGAPYYATVARADNPTQEGTALNKYNLLKDATAAMFGMDGGAVPDDVFAWLGKYNLHWWKRKAIVSATRYKMAKTAVDSPSSSRIFSVLTHGASYLGGYQVYKTATVDPVSGVVTLGSPFAPSSSSQYKDCYVTGGVVVNYNTTDAYTDNDGVYYLDSSVSLAAGSNSQRANFTQENVFKVTAEAYQIDVGGTDFVQSSNPEAYPRSGNDGSFEYTYLGQPLENAVTAPKIATGTYTGTGKYGEANPSSLTLPFEANTLIIVGTDGFLAVCPHLTTSYVFFKAHTVNSSDYKLGGLFVKKNGNTVQRYSTDGSPAATWTPRFQANASGTTYRYIAWG